MVLRPFLYFTKLYLQQHLFPALINNSTPNNKNKSTPSNKNRSRTPNADVNRPNKNEDVDRPSTNADMNRPNQILIPENNKTEPQSVTNTNMESERRSPAKFTVKQNVATWERSIHNYENPRGLFMSHAPFNPYSSMYGVYQNIYSMSCQ